MKTGEHTLLSASCRLAYSMQVEPELRGKVRVLTHLFSGVKRMGHAKSLMNRLCAMADEGDITFLLNPRQEGPGMSDEQLADWYSESFGFFMLQPKTDAQVMLLCRLPYESQPVQRFEEKPIVSAAIKAVNG